MSYWSETLKDIFLDPPGCWCWVVLDIVRAYSTSSFLLMQRLIILDAMTVLRNDAGEYGVGDDSTARYTRDGNAERTVLVLASPSPKDPKQGRHQQPPREATPEPIQQSAAVT